MEKKFVFFEDILLIDKSRMKYNDLRIKFKKLAYNLAQRYGKTYKKENSNIEDVSRKGYEQGLIYIREGIEEAIKLLLDHNIYDIDMDTFIDKYYLKYYTWEEEFNKINDKYLSIILEQKDLDAYRVARREGRGKVVGGGFGAKGAAKGMATAGALNMATGAVHGTFNLAGKAISSIGADMDKSKLFKDDSTFNILYSGVYMSIFNIHLAVVDVLTELRGIEYKYVSRSDADEADGIFNNIKSKIISSDKELELLKKIFLLNPYNLEYYKYVIENYGDENLNIQDISDYFFVEIEDYKDKLINKKYEEMDKSNEDAAVEAKKQVLKLMDYYGVKTSLSIEDINSRLEEFDIKARTFKGLTYDSREEARKAKNDYSELEKRLEDLEEKEELEVITLKEDIIQKDYSSVIKDIFVEKLDSRLEKIDLEKRTVENIVFETRDEAEVAREESNILYELFKGINERNEEELLKLKDDLENKSFETKIVDLYEKKLNEYLYNIKVSKERNDINKIILEMNMLDDQNIDKVRKSIETEFNTEIKASYLSLLDNINPKNIKKAQKYNKSKEKGSEENFKKYGIAIVITGILSFIDSDFKIFMFLSIIIFLVKLINLLIYKKAWKDLTLDGEVVNEIIKK